MQILNRLQKLEDTFRVRSENVLAFFEGDRVEVVDGFQKRTYPLGEYKRLTANGDLVVAIEFTDLPVAEGEE
jgi:hypothetical protein